MSDMNADNHNGFRGAVSAQSGGTNWPTAFIHVSDVAQPPPGPRRHTLSDINGDGRDDLVWQHGDNSIHSLVSNGNTFSGVGTTVGYGRPDWAGMGDVNGDGRDDVIFAEGSGIHTLFSNGATFGSASLTAGYTNPQWAGIGDVNGDGRDDLVWQHGDNSIHSLVSNGNTFSGVGTTVRNVSRGMRQLLKRIG